MKNIMTFKQLNESVIDLSDEMEQIKSDNPGIKPVLIMDLKRIDLADFNKIHKWFKSLSHIRFPNFSITDGVISRNTEADPDSKSLYVVMTVGFNNKGVALFNEAKLAEILKKSKTINHISVL